LPPCRDGLVEPPGLDEDSDQVDECLHRTVLVIGLAQDGHAVQLSGDGLVAALACFSQHDPQIHQCGAFTKPLAGLAEHDECPLVGRDAIRVLFKAGEGVAEVCERDTLAVEPFLIGMCVQNADPAHWRVRLKGTVHSLSV
jgi:hypothetical protein